MPQGIIHPPLENALRHHSHPAGECLKASFAPNWLKILQTNRPCYLTGAMVLVPVKRR